jgi:RNA polymerase sigma-70 factor (ECF subfamily)
MNQISPEFISRLFDRHAAALELFAAQWARAPADAVQEAFLKLATQTKPPEHPVAWLYRVVRNAAISAARSEGRRERNEKETLAGARPWFVPADGDRIDAQAATEALQSLADEEREVVVARIWGELTFEEIAEVAGISSSTAHRRYESALASLRERLGVSWLTKIETRK